MRTILRVAAILIATSSVATAQDANPLATRSGLEVGAQLAGYEYEEPNFAKLKGNRIGVVGAATLAGESGLFGRVDLRWSYGLLDYEGSGTLSNVPDFIIETRALGGFDWIGENGSLSPYLGLGFRYLFNDLRGYNSVAAGYRRYSNYLYVPVGLIARFRLGEGWILVPTLEADVFLGGRQMSMLSDTGIPGYIDVTNKQSSGRGGRASLMFEKDRWAFGAFMNYWHIDASDVVFAGVVGGITRTGQEPENFTREYGLEVRYRF